MRARMKWVFMGAATLLAAAAVSQAVTVETVAVGNPGNPAHSSGYGRVNYSYQIGKYEVTAAQYTDFLNAVAATDTYSLYNPNMWGAAKGCKIARSGSAGSYTYSVASDWADRPVNVVNWGDAMRYANWLHHGRPTGVQNARTTEDGAYAVNGAMSEAALMAVVRKPIWRWAVTSEDEWFKAAYHKNNGVTGNYFAYPTGSDTPPGYIPDGGSIPAPDPGNYATYDGDAGLDGIGPPYYRTVAGEHENSASRYGTFDQGGNVAELNEAVYSPILRGQRGGLYDNVVTFLGINSRRFYSPVNESDNVGFRVVCNPNPRMLGTVMAVR